MVLVCNVGGGYDALLGKRSLPRIDEKVGIRSDCLEVSTGGVPIIIEGRRYLGNRHCQEVDLEQSTHCLLLEVGRGFDPYEAKYQGANTRVKNTNHASILWVKEVVKSDKWVFDLSPDNVCHREKFSRHRSALFVPNGLRYWENIIHVDPGDRAWHGI